jgi:pyruvate,water dikinase
MTALTDPVRGTSDPQTFWTMTNVAEATPDILSPLCWSVWGRALEESWLGVLRSMGVLSAQEAIPSANPNDHTTSVIYGRQAFNVDALRRNVARLPGIDPDDFERDIMGSVRSGLAKEPRAPQRLPVVAVRTPWTLLTSNRTLARAHTQVQTWWRSDVFGVDVTAGIAAHHALQRLRDARDRFARIFGVHLRIRLQLQSVQSLLSDAAEKAGDPTLAERAFTGHGALPETVMADQVWRLGREELSEHTFLSEYGYHGPNEGNVFTRSWREDPTVLRSIAVAMAERAGSLRPRDREAAAVASGNAARAELLRRSNPVMRVVLNEAFKRARNIVRNNEIGKSGYLMALDGCRAAAREVGRSQVRSGRLADVDDVFFLTIPEIAELIDGRLPAVADIVDYRKGTRADYQRMVLPVSFTGMPEVSYRAAESTSLGAVSVSDVSGTASGGGQVEGRARVVHDAGEDVELDDGDILVCRFTDPSWAPLFTLASALVIDLGGAASHGALVARELGIPFVIGTQNGTAVIGEGDRISVDGHNNRVRILARAAGSVD